MTDPIYDETKLVNPLSIQTTTAITQIYTLFKMGKSLEEVVDALVTSGTTIDATITEASTHPVQSAAIYTALAGKASVDLSDVNVGVANAGKTLMVDEDGSIKFVLVE